MCVSCCILYATLNRHEVQLNVKFSSTGEACEALNIRRPNRFISKSDLDQQLFLRQA